MIVRLTDRMDGIVLIRADEVVALEQWHGQATCACRLTLAGGTLIMVKEELGVVGEILERALRQPEGTWLNPVQRVRPVQKKSVFDEV